MHKTQGTVSWASASWREDAARQELEARLLENAQRTARAAAIARQPSKTVRRFLRRWDAFCETPIKSSSR